MLTELDEKILDTLAGDFPITAEPWRLLAEKIGVSEADLLAEAERLKAEGYIRRFGLVLRHRKAGFRANALCAWKVPKEREDEVGAMMAAHPSITHCYTRKIQPDWPYNLYTMIHAGDKAELEAIVNELSKATGLIDKRIFFTVQEWKKETLRLNKIACK